MAKQFPKEADELFLAARARFFRCRSGERPVALQILPPHARHAMVITRVHVIIRRGIRRVPLFFCFALTFSLCIRQVWRIRKCRLARDTPYGRRGVLCALSPLARFPSFVNYPAWYAGLTAAPTPCYSYTLAIPYYFSSLCLQNDVFLQISTRKLAYV